MYKSLTVAVCAVLIAVQGVAQTKSNALTFEPTIEKAVQLNKKGNKQVLLHITSSKSENARKMENLTFRLGRVKDFMLANFTHVKVDISDSTNQGAIKQYGISMVPSYLILDKEGKEVGRVIGYADADEFIGKLKLAMDPANSLQAKKEAYEKYRNYESTLAYMEVLHREFRYNELTDLVENSIYAFPIEQRYSVEMWKYYKIALRRTTSRVFSMALGEKYLLNQHIGKSEVDKVMAESLQNYALQYISGKVKDHEAISSAYLSYLPIIDDQSAKTHYISIACKLFAQKDMQMTDAKAKAYKGMADYLTAEKIAALNEADRAFMIHFFKSIEGMPKEHIANFEAGINDYFKKF